MMQEKYFMHQKYIDKAGGRFYNTPIDRDGVQSCVPSFCIWT